MWDGIDGTAFLIAKFVVGKRANGQLLDSNDCVGANGTALAKMAKILPSPRNGTVDTEGEAAFGAQVVWITGSA